MSTVTDIVREDAVSILRCPECHASGLNADTDGRLTCAACGAEFPFDGAMGVGALLSRDSATPIKEDIRRWWGDLYAQLYGGQDDTMDDASLAAGLAQLEDLFRHRQHLAVVEMPLAELRGKTVLEIGPGAGAHSALFESHGASVVAVDITAERAASTAHKLHLVNGGIGRAYQADAENLPFRDGAFDIVYSNGVLHHSENTDACIDEVHRVLKPGGLAVIMLYSRHSASFWCNIVPRAIFGGEIFGHPEAQWIGRVTEGKPKFGETRNPITRVYSAAQLRKLFHRFTGLELRKSSFQFDNFAIPRLTQIRAKVLTALGCRPHEGGRLVYGAPFVPETALELALGKWLGFAWNIRARKPEADRNP